MPIFRLVSCESNSSERISGSYALLVSPSTTIRTLPSTNGELGSGSATSDGSCVAHPTQCNEIAAIHNAPARTRSLTVMQGIIGEPCIVHTFPGTNYSLTLAERSGY